MVHCNSEVLIGLKAMVYELIIIPLNTTTEVHASTRATRELKYCNNYSLCVLNKK